MSLIITEGETIKQVLEYLRLNNNLSYITCDDGSSIEFLEHNTSAIGESEETESDVMLDTVFKLTGAKKEVSCVNYYYNPYPDIELNTEDYDRIYENTFFNVLDNPLSTFAIDVDTASYANIRRYINQEQLPPEDAVRIEEMINYFTYKYPAPVGDQPFSINVEVSDCPWNKQNQLLLIGVQGEKVKTENLPPNNLVFLLDVSGSMQDANKLPLLKKALKLMVGELREEDRVSIVVYAGRSAVVLDSTSGKQKQNIITALDMLGAGGSTAGSAGIQKAYQIARQNYLPEGNNRVILATDGDFNVGVSSTGDLVRMIEEKRDEGIFLTVLGFGTGNYKGSRMEELSNKGNGNYAYIDNLLEAKKVLINELGGTLLTIAKDVKIQLEFNPAKIKEYRLIGYENRVMENKDFSDDSKDAGELGAGHSVTAFYEMVPVDGENLDNSSDLKYQQGIIKAESSYQNVIELAKGARGEDDFGYRAEFIKLVEMVELINMAVRKR